MKNNIILFSAVFFLSIAMSCNDYIDDMDFKTGLNNGLVTYWPVMGTDCSGLEYDYKGHNNIVNNSIAPKTTGKYSTALEIQNLTTIYCNTFTFPIRNEATISAWIYMIGAKGFSIELSDGTIDLILVSGPNYTRSFFTLSTDEAQTADFNQYMSVWTYFTGTYDGKILKLYINGNLVATAPSTNTLVSFNQASLSGYCRLDEIRIYNRALSQDEIKALMNIGMD